MINAVMKALLGTKNERELKKLDPLVARINELEPGIKALSDEALRAKTVEFRARLSEAVDARFKDVADPDPAEVFKAGQAFLGGLLPEAFACVREAGVRAVGMRHFDVQLIGGMILHQGRIAEMKTGEGKTLVATLAAHQRLLTRRVHRHRERLPAGDAEWMGRITASSA